MLTMCKLDHSAMIIKILRAYFNFCNSLYDNYIHLILTENRVSTIKKIRTGKRHSDTNIDFKQYPK